MPRAAGAALLLAAVCALAVPGPGAVAQRAPAAGPTLMVIDTRQVLERSAAGRRLARTEQEVRQVVEARLEEVTAALEAEERELTRLRDELPADRFAVRTRDFDRRVRLERRAAQERGALLLRFFEESRERLRAALPPVLERLRRDAGATVVLDRGAVAAAAPSADLTDQALARFDAAVEDMSFDPPAALLGP